MNQDEFRASIKAERDGNPIGSVSVFTKAEPSKMVAADFCTLSIGNGSLIVDDGAVLAVDLETVTEIKIRLTKPTTPGEQVTA